MCSYRKLITHPMDVGKMLRKLERGEYSTLGEIAKDLKQIIWKYVNQVAATSSGESRLTDHMGLDSCRKYNGLDSFPDREWATPFERKVLDTWPRLVDTRLISDEKRLIITWMERTAKSDVGIWFARPGMFLRVWQGRSGMLADHFPGPPQWTPLPMHLTTSNSEYLILAELLLQVANPPSKCLVSKRKTRAIFGPSGKTCSGPKTTASHLRPSILTST